MQCFSKLFQCTLRCLLTTASDTYGLLHEATPIMVRCVRHSLCIWYHEWRLPKQKCCCLTPCKQKCHCCFDYHKVKCFLISHGHRHFAPIRNLDRCVYCTSGLLLFLNPQAKVRMKYRISYHNNGQEVVEMGEVSDFPVL